MPTRDDVMALFRRDFDQNAQERMCAMLLETMRGSMSDSWWNCTTWTREQTEVVSVLIRQAGESRDFSYTADFITKDVCDVLLESIEASSGRRRRHLNKRKGRFHHEHMVPGGVALRLLAERDNPETHGALAPLLAKLDFRALLGVRPQAVGRYAGISEAKRLDGLLKLKSVVPEPSKIIGWRGPARLTEVPWEFYGLVRYDAAGLLDDGNLLTVSSRANRTLERYLLCKAGEPPQALAV